MFAQGRRPARPRGHTGFALEIAATARSAPIGPARAFTGVTVARGRRFVGRRVERLVGVGERHPIGRRLARRLGERHFGALRFAITFAIIAGQERVSLEFAFDILLQLQIGELKQLDRLLELRRDDQALALPELQSLTERHRALPEKCELNWPALYPLVSLLSVNGQAIGSHSPATATRRRST